MLKVKYVTGKVLKNDVGIEAEKEVDKEVGVEGEEKRYGWTRWQGLGRNTTRGWWGGDVQVRCESGRSGGIAKAKNLAKLKEKKGGKRYWGSVVNR